MEYKHLLVEISEGIGTITINRPQSLNALNSETLNELKSALEHLEKEVGAVIITGSGDKAFVAGADISEMALFNPVEAMRYAKLGQDVMFKIENLKVPVLAAVNGYALGAGTELAMACDIRIASEKAVFGQPEVKLGVTPGFGGTQRLPRLVGKGRAAEIIFSGDNVDAAEAHRMGLVNKVVLPDKLMEETRALAKKIMSRGMVAVKLAKSMMNEGGRTNIRTGCEIEAKGFALCFSSEDQKEGMRAFMEKRKPEFKGR